MESNIRKRLKDMFSIEESNIICKLPKNMLLELTNCCNDSCLFCANSKCTKKRGFIEPSIAKKILKEAYTLGVRDVGFYGTGEPLLDNNLEQYISYAKELGYEYVYITTNGALMTEERANSIVEAGIDSIKFSINATNREDYLLIHGKDEFEKVIRNLQYLSNLRKSNKSEFALYISYVVTRYTNCNMEVFKKDIEKYVDDIIFEECINLSGYMSNEIINHLSVDENAGYHPEHGICPRIFNDFYVTYEGYLSMCCADFQNYLVIADLKEESLEEAWNNEYAQQLRRRHLEHKLEGTLCFNCMHNKASKILPLKKEYSICFDSDNWNKTNEILKRVCDWKK